MKKLRRVFELTVAQQRAIIVLLLLYVIYVLYDLFGNAPIKPPPAQPSPSPGILP